MAAAATAAVAPVPLMLPLLMMLRASSISSRGAPPLMVAMVERAARGNEEQLAVLEPPLLLLDVWCSDPMSEEAL